MKSGIGKSLESLHMFATFLHSGENVINFLQMTVGGSYNKMSMVSAFSVIRITADSQLFSLISRTIWKDFEDTGRISSS